MFTDLVALAPALFVLPVVAFEIAVGLLMLSKGTYARWGHFARIVFLVAITPLGVWTLANPVMAVAMAVLLRNEYDRSLPEVLHLTARPRGGTHRGGTTIEAVAPEISEER